MLCSSISNAQVAERERPKEWDNLILGGRFMDRFFPMPIQGELTSDTWGAANVVPRYTENGLENNEWSYWGGNAKLGADGKYHLFVCGWREDSPKGHMQWPRSSVFHAVADNSFGPYSVKDTVGSGHNPEVFQLEDGRYVVYVINGYYIADNLNGPWEKGEFEFNKRDRKIIEGLSNLTFAKREDGTYLMVCRGGGVWFSKTGISPYNQVSAERVYPPVEGRFEDPLIWKTNVQYHLIVNDWLGRIAWYLRSKDGINWKTDPGEAYLPGVAKYEDGTVVDWFKYERIKVLQDKYGRATQAHFAVIDTLKRQDKMSDNHSSKHICIPLTVGRLLTILNSEKIDSKTKTIKVKVEAEKGFNPQLDIDLESLRFGASEQVNFGRGSKVLKTENSGDDLIITFEGNGNGLTDENFAAKLLGKLKDGNLLFGYARLPQVDYIEPALSSRLPVFQKDSNRYIIEVEVQNFGQVKSEITKLKLVNKKEVGEPVFAEAEIPVLQPFEKIIIELSCDDTFEKKSEYYMEVIIESENQKPVTLKGRVVPNK
ncbi:MAG: hypothetical protein HQ522_00760 [Bacteroidetes bacterium]|nr:hypothetical protein [Bacteroidota bacterium]